MTLQGSRPLDFGCLRGRRLVKKDGRDWHSLARQKVQVGSAGAPFSAFPAWPLEPQRELVELAPFSSFPAWPTWTNEMVPWLQPNLEGKLEKMGGRLLGPRGCKVQL